MFTTCKRKLTAGRINRILSQDVQSEEKQLKISDINKKLTVNQTKGVNVCSSERWTKLGEKCAKYLVGLENWNYTN